MTGDGRPPADATGDAKSPVDATTSIARAAERGIRCALVVVFVEGLRRRNPGAVVNAVVSLAVTFLPAVVERLYGVEFRPWQRVYVESGMLTHAVGMLGPYDGVPWWDHLTHAHSASILGGLLHVAARRRDRDPRRTILAGVVGGGVLWELAEYAIHAVCRRVGLEPLLVSYGRRDTALDLVFNLLGALLVLALGDRLLGNLAGDEEAASDGIDDE